MAGRPGWGIWSWRDIDSRLTLPIRQIDSYESILLIAKQFSLAVDIVDMYQEETTISVTVPDPASLPDGESVAGIFSDGAILFVIVMTAIVLITVASVKAWAILELIRHRRGSRRNPRRRLRFVGYIVTIVTIFVTSQVGIFSIIFG